MIVFVYGTTGELIKLAPVIHRVRERGLAWLSISTEQQPEQLGAMLDDLRLPGPDLIVGDGFRGADLSRPSQLPRWGATVARSLLLSRGIVKRHISASPGRPVVMVHGDTLTTVIGAVLGKLLGVPVAHLEAGMRSHNLRHPFPEELDRRVAGRLTDIHYATSEREARNLRNCPGDVVIIGANTVRDSLDLVPDDGEIARRALGDLLPQGRYGIVSLHRTELLIRRDLLDETLVALAEAAIDVPLLFVAHPVTMAAIERHGLGRHLASGRLRRIPRLPYTAFVSLMRGCELMVTDSGGGQEETHFLDVPCAIHRLTTEHATGIGSTVVLTHHRIDVLRDFLSDPARYRMGRRPDRASPSDVVVEDLRSRGVWSAAASRHAAAA